PQIWGASYLIRGQGLKSGEAGTWLALVLGMGGMAGMFGTGLLADRLGVRDARWRLWICAILLAVVAPLFAATFLAPDARTALLLGVVPFAVAAAFTGPAI